MYHVHDTFHAHFSSSPFGEITNFDILQHLSKWKKKKFLAQFTLLAFIANAKREPSSRIRESRKTRKRALKQSRPRPTHRTAIHSRCSMAHTCTVRLYSRPFSSRYSYYFHSHQPLWEAISTSLEDLSFSSIRQHASPRLHISKNFQFRKEIFSRVLYTRSDSTEKSSIRFFFSLGELLSCIILKIWFD